MSNQHDVADSLSEDDAELPRPLIALVVGSRISALIGRELVELRAALAARVRLHSEELTRAGQSESDDKRARTGLAALSRLGRLLDGYALAPDALAERRALATRRIVKRMGRTTLDRTSPAVQLEAAHGPTTAVTDGKESSK